MPKPAKKSAGSLDGCFKVLMISAVLGFIGVLLLGVIGGVVYMNREKLGIPPMEEWAERFEAAMEESEGGDSASAAPSHAVRRPVVSMAPMYVNTASFSRVSKRSDVLVLVDYYADWCGPCKLLAPSLAKLVQQHGDKVIVLKVNVDSERQLAQQAGVRSIPDVRLLYGGKQVDQFVGVVPYEKIEKMILKHEALLPPPRQVLPRATGEGSIDPVTKKYLPPGISRK